MLVSLWRGSWDAPQLAYVDELSPEMNVHALYWRITGIGREQMAGQRITLVPNLLPRVTSGALLDALFGRPPGTAEYVSQMHEAFGYCRELPDTFLVPPRREGYWA